MADFTFKQISNSGTAYSSFAAASINNAGTVSFEAFQSSPQGFPIPAAILSGSGGQTTTVADRIVEPMEPAMVARADGFAVATTGEPALVAD